MKSKCLLLLLLFLQTLTNQSRAESDENRVFRTITAADGLADNSAQLIKCTLTGRLTICTLGNINFYDGGDFKHIDSEDEEKYKLEDYNGEYRLYYDNNHHLWLKNRNSVSCVNLATERFFSNVDSIFATYGARSRVNDMFVDQKGDVWLCVDHYVFCKKYGKKIGLLSGRNLQDLNVIDERYLLLFYDNGLLKCYDLKSGKSIYQNFAYGTDDRKKYGHTCVHLIHDGNLYLIRNGARSDGSVLLRYNLARREWKEIVRKEFTLNNMVVRDGILYIASAKGYLTYNLETADIIHYESLTLNTGRELVTDVNVIEFDLQGGMWMGTEKRGVLYDRPVNTNFQIYPMEHPIAAEYIAKMENMKGISEFKGKRASMIFFDSRRWTWVTTPNGLYMYMSPQAKPVIFSTKNGLLNNVTHAVVEDNMHNIWISTSFGISCVYIKNNEIKRVLSFDRYDNVPNETFVDAKAIKDEDGKIAMLTTDHVIVFNPANFISSFEEKAYEMHPKLTKLMVNGIDVTAGDKVNDDVVLEKAITRTKIIDLNYDQNSISLTFSALNFARPLQSYYKVRVKELNPNWREFSFFGSYGLVDRRGLLHLPMLGLEPGVYHIELLASTVPGEFVGTPYVWEVHVNQPWWRTTGILAIFGLIVLGLAVLNFVIFNRNTRLRIRRNNEEGDVIRRIKVFVERCDNLTTEKLSPTQEEIYGTDKESQVELSDEFVNVMLRVIPYVHERNGRPFSMHMLSRVTDMELLELYEMVSENIYKSPRALIRIMRIDQVAEMLRKTEKSVEEVAEECGFVSPNYMISKFYHKYRMTPEEYREEYAE